MLYSHIQLHNTYTNISGNTVNNNDDLNERMNTRLYKKYTLFSKGLRKGWCWLCERGELETETDCHILTQSSSGHSSTSFSSWLDCSNVGHWGPKLILTLASCPPTDSNSNWNSKSNWRKPSVAPGYIFVWLPPASYGRTHLHRIQPRPQVKVIFRYLRPDALVSPFFRLFTQVHLLIDGSVEGQYVTLACFNMIRMR